MSAVTVEPAAGLDQDRIAPFVAWTLSHMQRGMMNHKALSRVAQAGRAMNRSEADTFVKPLGTSLTVPDRVGMLQSRLIPLSVANAFVLSWHRHHSAVVGHMWSAGVYDDAGLLGVAIVSLPRARMLNDGHTLEVVRIAAPPGVRNVISHLYGAVRKEARRCNREEGTQFKRVVTYTMPEEAGMSLRASGFGCTGTTQGGSRDTPSRRRKDKAPTSAKLG